MKRFLVTIIFAAVAAAGAHADDSFDRQYTPCGYSNGRAWAMLDSARKTYYLRGFLDRDYVSHDPNTYWNAGVAIGDIHKSLDRFYDDPANVLIGVPNAISIVNAQLRGEVRDLNIARQAASECTQNEVGR